MTRCRTSDWAFNIFLTVDRENEADVADRAGRVDVGNEFYCAPHMRYWPLVWMRRRSKPHGEMQNENLNQKAIPWKPDFSGFCGRAVVCLFAGSSPAAEGVNYIDLFRTRAIKCIHPTVNPEKATVETVKEPEAKGDTTTVRVKAFYQGLLKKDSMEADLMIRQAGSIRQMKIQVLSDTGSVHKPCTLEQNWQDF